jgi:hypothetical protein
MLNPKPADNSVLNNLTSIMSYRIECIASFEYEIVHVNFLSFNNRHNKLFCSFAFFHRRLVETTDMNFDSPILCR